jgi:hypothetical protein
MAGYTTNGLPAVGPLVQNGTTVAIPPLTQIPSTALLAADVPNTTGAPPISVAVNVFQIAAHAAALIKNTATSTAGAATLNAVEGLIQTESLSTAPGSTYTMTITNSLVAATSPIPSVEMLFYSNTAGQAQLNSITNGAGSVVAVFQNTGTAAFNGTFLIPFHL